MWWPKRFRSPRPVTAERPPRPSLRRDRLARLLALITLAALGAVFARSSGTEFLMPGPLTSAHGPIGICSACHAKSGNGKLSWVHGLLGGDRLADSKSCLTCHTMSQGAFNAHGAASELLKESTERLAKYVVDLPQAPPAARAQGAAFPTHEMVTRGLNCATCHQEHRGLGFDLRTVPSAQCRSCHVLKFDSFDGDHPKFDGYPFDRRTRIVYDHAGHFNKHYPEVAKKDPSRRIPATCSSCHESRENRRIMAVKPFDETCAGCHLDQIRGKERASGPKGLAFLTIPGLDLETLKKKGASIGEWPDASEAALTPFMRLMLGRSGEGRELLSTVDRLNLADLTNASDDEIKAVTSLVWNIKKLIYALVSGKAPEIVGDLTRPDGAKVSASLATDLVASLPHDVLAGAQREWLPNLAAEIANGRGATASAKDTAPPDSPDTGPQTEAPPTAETRGAEAEARDGGAESGASDSPDEPAGADSQGAGSTPARAVKTDPQPCLVRVLGQCLVFKEPAQTDAADPEAAIGDLGADDAGDSGKPKRPNELPPAMRAGVRDGNATGTTKADAVDARDELLFPSEEELKELNARRKQLKKPLLERGPADGGNSGADSAGDAGAPSPEAAATDAEGDIDPESWAEYGGWYRQDYAILYRPTGHKDRLIHAWLSLTGPLAQRGDKSPAAAIFSSLTDKDAQGSCTKCHSVDEVGGQGRRVNFSPLTTAMKRGHFTTFVHEPHFRIEDDRGCLGCHALGKDSPYLKSYEQGDPHVFASGFAAVGKDRCQTCHNGSKARQDCLLCHNYHVNGVTTPITGTKNPVP